MSRSLLNHLGLSLFSRLETAASLAPKDEEEKVKTKDTVAKSHEKNGHTKRRGRKRHSHRRARSVSVLSLTHKTTLSTLFLLTAEVMVAIRGVFVTCAPSSVSLDADISPRPVPKTKKKKKKSQRKRRRHRSPSCSPSPVRKKKKKSSKKRKRHRTASRKGRHSAPQLLSESTVVGCFCRVVSRTEGELVQSKSSSSLKQASSQRDRNMNQFHAASLLRTQPGKKCLAGLLILKTFRFCQGATLIADTGAGKLKLGVFPAWKTDMKFVKNLVSKMVLIHQLSMEAMHAGTYVPFKEYSYCIMQVSPSRPGGLNKMMIVQDSISNKVKGQADYDSGNDTSSPPSSKTGITRSKVTRNGRFSCQDLTCPERLRLADGDNASDSGNSLTSYDSLGKAVLRENTLHSSVFNKLKGEETGRYADLEKTQPLGLVTDRNRSPSYDRYQDRTRSRSRSISSQSRYSGRYSRNRSLSSGRRSYSRSSSYSLNSRRDSLSSVSSCRSLNYSRCTTDR
ncbi:Serine/arginine repetitive matrix protein 4 [Anabarilius grahami]|uniref:Serine/arginine repetitive matrix protein 4 n=1 Tax=Anabarilius grahami TaxID=495550 RepID=A0A3N0XGV1_ANAGA|nr:Serine/arginine repetitive matrix protein 4 [Anabarilius grahami]